MKKAIKPDQIKQYAQKLRQDPTANLVRRAVSQNGILKSAVEQRRKTALTPVFSIDVTNQSVSDQKRSGRCWLFAALNTMRSQIENQFNVSKDFELSQVFVFFWDKFEKANYFLNNVLATADRPLTDRKVNFLLQQPQQDGGQWDMLCALVEKYGIVPKDAMPETANSANSSEINRTLNTKLRHDAVILRKMQAANATASEIAHQQESMLAEVYRMLVLAFGEPVESFDFEYRDQQNHYQIDRHLTPKTFFKKYINLDLEDYLSIINSPTADKPFEKTYTVELLGNVVGGRPVKHFNLSIERLKELTIKQLQANETVWFGSDVTQASDRQAGLLDPELYQVDELMGTNLSLSKAERLDYGESVMDHAMVITGVDLVDGQPTKWKIENSWGPKVGTKGYFVMSDQWFEQFVYQVVINKKYLSATEQAAQQQEPTVLAPWDPMGTLA